MCFQCIVEEFLVKGIRYLSKMTMSVDNIEA